MLNDPISPLGVELEEPVVRLGLWGSKSLGRPKRSDFFNVSSLSIALRGAFHPERAKGQDVLFDIQLDGRRLHVLVRGGQVAFPAEPPSKPRLVLETAPEVFAELLAGYLDLDPAVASGRVQVHGPKREARRFFEIFRLPPREQAPPRHEQRA